MYDGYCADSDAEPGTGTESDVSEFTNFPDGDKADILDLGNQEVRSEGMAFGMMIAVQLDKQEEFDKLWN